MFEGEGGLQTLPTSMQPAEEQGSLHYTPEHCRVNGASPLFSWKKTCFKWATCIFCPEELGRLGGFPPVAARPFDKTGPGLASSSALGCQTDGRTACTSLGQGPEVWGPQNADDTRRIDFNWGVLGGHSREDLYMSR